MAAGNPNARPSDPDGLVLEAWGQGLMVGSLVVMAALTFSNMKRRILLHKLIFAELILALPHGTFIFAKPPTYGWYLSVSAIGLNISWSLHNVISWMKNKPFLSRRVSRFYIVTVLLVQPYWVLEIYANFAFFNNFNTVFLKTRPWEPLFRDPWWIFTTISLFYTIKREYNFGILELVAVSPRFGVMLASMCLSIVFIIVDTCAVLNAFEGSGLPTGIEPFWKLAFIFKCLCDIVILDDFKTALDRMRTHWIRKRARSGEILLADHNMRERSGPWAADRNGDESGGGDRDRDRDRRRRRGKFGDAGEDGVPRVYLREDVSV
ncbi:hypothetical protein N8T08_006797 [Aspergillus melleus]|uniref:Uncharacterized protein n=1 Tax=Aspergillus melleus TaxID=138277 RepID=A0ACC3AZ37_9EURO|nr:hypothetical protein N8T08_006797 [Aspergillus melleus]